MDTKASKKQGGRPKKVVNYDHEYIIDFLRLFITDAQSWDDCIGKSVEMNDLIERDVYGKFFEMDMLDKLKEVLVVKDYNRLRPSKKFNNINNLISLLRQISKSKMVSVYINYYCEKGDRHKRVSFCRKLV